MGGLERVEARVPAAAAGACATAPHCGPRHAPRLLQAHSPTVGATWARGANVIRARRVGWEERGRKREEGAQRQSESCLFSLFAFTRSLHLDASHATLAARIHARIQPVGPSFETKGIHAPARASLLAASLSLKEGGFLADSPAGDCSSPPRRARTRTHAPSWA